MGLAARAATLFAALAAGVLAVGCGGSVVDADAPARTGEPARPASPFCAAARANSDAIRPLNGLVARGGAPPAELSSTVDAVRRAGADLLVTAPGEIRSDVERTVQAVDLQLDALIANGGNSVALRNDPALAARLGAPELVAAAERVSAYVTSTCGSRTG